MDHTRRGFLAAVGTAAIAGCADLAPEPNPEPAAATGSNTADDDSTPIDLSEDQSSIYARVAERVAESVIRVRIYDEGGQIGQGSGFLNRGHVITNEHVVYGGERVRLQYPNDRWYDGDVRGTDPYSDLAVVTPGRDMNTADAPPELQFADVTPPIGTEVLAFGAPFGLGGSVTQGIISGRNRSLPAPNDFTIPDAVQTDAAINPGNSGGPLVTLDEQVAGVVTATQGENVGFAISAALANRIIPALIEDGQYDHSLLGVRVQPVTPTVATENDLDAAWGVYIVEVIPDGPSDGILEGAREFTTVNGQQVPLDGDILRGFEATEIRTNEDLARYLALETEPGDSITAHLLRDGEMTTETITLGTRPPPR